MLLDTDIIIWSLRGNDSATDYIDSLDEIFISGITYMELIQGTKSKKECRDLIKTLDAIEVQSIPISENISSQAITLVKTFAHSHSMQLADSLIASTAIIHNLPFTSGNKKHFEQIPELKFYVFRKKE
ncbi:MAG: VapC toxin family PIN domain ribonuclease [Proteobacteria bacterium]|nr:MAG: VapC toxin family PIN domain ribonuclease [Pseudomonadota bacterium]